MTWVFIITLSLGQSHLADALVSGNGLEWKVSPRAICGRGVLSNRPNGHSSLGERERERERDHGLSWSISSE